MRRALLTLSALAVLSASLPARAADWQLVWSDDFDGPGIDGARWEELVGVRRDELQYDTAREDNVSVSNGTLVIQAKSERYAGTQGVRSFTSARLRTCAADAWTYGRFEIRARLASGRGLRSTIGLLPVEPRYGDGAASGEIVVAEGLGRDPATVHGALHYGAAWPRNVAVGQGLTLPGTDFSGGFHVFAVEWERQAIRWYVDGHLFQTQTRWHTVGGPYPAPFDTRFRLVLTLAVGGGEAVDPDATTPFPQQLVVDYVRVYRARPPEVPAAPQPGTEEEAPPSTPATPEAAESTTPPAVDATPTPTPPPRDNPA